MRFVLPLLSFVIVLVAWSASFADPGHGFHVLASNNPPFNYQDDTGVVRGISVDVLKTIMERAYRPVDRENIQVINWARAVHKTTHEPNYALLSPARTPKRESMFAWVGPIHSFTLGLIARKARKIRIDGPDDLKYYAIGVIRDSAPAHILEDKYNLKAKDMHPLANDDQLFRMLDRGRVDLVPRGAMSATYWLERVGLNPDDYEMVHVLKKLDLYIGLSPGTDPDLVHRLNLELTKMKRPGPDGTSEYEDIVQRHIHGAPLKVNLPGNKD